MLRFGPIFADDWGVGPPSPFWFVRNGGNDANGGGFDPSYGGTNYADQDSPHYAAAAGSVDLSAQPAFPSQIAVTGGAIDASVVGNYVHVIGGTSIIPGWYLIVRFESPVGDGIDAIDLATPCIPSGSFDNTFGIKIGGAFATLTEAQTQQTAFGGTIIDETSGAAFSAYYAAYYQRVVAQEQGA